MILEILQSLPQVLIDGLALGAVYAVVALGYTMVYGILQLINFAHGEIFMSGAFIGTAICALLMGMSWFASIPQIILLIRCVSCDSLLDWINGNGNRTCGISSS